MALAHSAAPSDGRGRTAVALVRVEYGVAEVMGRLHGDSNATLAHNQVDALNAAVDAWLQQVRDALDAALHALELAIVMPIIIFGAELCISGVLLPFNCFE